MNLLYLRYFVKAAETEHITNAARELFISQPALSKAISSLEKELQVPLLESHGRNIRLSEYGKIFYPAAKTALERIDGALAELRERQETENSTIRLAALCFTSLIPDLLSSFRAQCPHVDFVLYQHIPFERAIEGADICLASSPEHLPGVTYIELLRDELLVAVPREHRLAGRERVSLGDLRGESFIGFDRRTNLRNTVDRMCERYHFFPNYVFESDDPATIKRLIASNVGIGFVPAIPWRMYPTDNIVLLPLEGEKEYRTIELCCKAAQGKNGNIALFRDFSVNFFRELMVKYGTPDPS